MRQQLLGLPRTAPDWSAKVPDGLRERIKDRPLLVSVSGGKDSTVMAHWLINYAAPWADIRLVHADTGWEREETDHYVRELLPAALGRPIEIVSDCPDLDADGELVARTCERLLGKGRSAYVRWIIKKSAFSARTMKWCTEYLKVQPLQQYMRDNGGRFVNCVGVRAQESRKRAGQAKWDIDGERKAGGLIYPVWRPLIDWSEAEVIAYHHDHDLPINPLYIQGASRVGCWPCINSRKHEIAQVARTDAARVEVIRILERFMTWRALERAASKGEPITHPDGTERFRAYFQNPENKKHTKEAEAAGLDPADVVRAQAKIGDVIRWATNDGPDVEAASWEVSCSKWGYCELPE